MKRYIIDVQKSVQNPSYLKPHTTFDMRPLLIPLDKKYIKRVGGPMFSNTIYEFPDDVSVTKSFKITDDSAWPSATDLNLDQSQFKALKSAVTKEFAIIQGPPGTGKTYVGLRFIQLMLHNIDQWFKEGTNSLPILIVCYTNHALDQFLEGVLLFTNKIIRIGGKGKNEAIEKYQISNLIKSGDYRKNHLEKAFWIDDLYESIRMTRSEIETIKIIINQIKEYIEDSTKTLIKQPDLEKYIPPFHLESLKKDFRQYYKLRGTNNKISDWLKAHVYGESSVVNNRQEMKNPAFDTNMEIETEGEADIEFIENQRNIDQYKFEDIFKKKSNKLEEELFQSQQKNKLNLKYIKHSLENTVAMKHYQARRIRNIWVLPINVRWQLYKYWLGIFINDQQEKYLYLQNKLKIRFKEITDLYVQRDLEVIKGSCIVGMTTTGAAKYRHIVKEMKPAILLVEEAAEILESHIITSLAAETQHVVLIGDQQQLRPSPAVYMLAVKYDMNVSLFERMIKNGVEYCRLSTQHRMRPEIASLIVPHIYSDLKNHKVVTEFENIRGVSKNVFFITHNFSEMQIHDSKSRVNEHEAKFLIKLCKHILLQGYEPSQITVLTTYLGQLFSLKKLAVEELEGVRFTVVDNFQGEENDIILISFVRSNDEGEVGFLKVSNRVCVALSRAKKGLYCIGNFELLAEKSKLWKNIVHTLSDNKSIGSSLRLVCQNHPDVSSNVATDADFALVPDGGCSQNCSYRLKCGHSCIFSCHVYDQSHEYIKCEKPCNTVCKNSHPCPKKCFEECGYCEVEIDRTLSKCRHTVSAPCGLEEKKIQCPIKVYRTLFPCGHVIKAPCGKPDLEIVCHEPCVKKCEKGHTCPQKCFERCKLCPVMVDRTLSRCGHVINAACGKLDSEICCKKPCAKKCAKGHNCPKNCFESCGVCKVFEDKSLKRCGHVVKAECYLSDLRVQRLFSRCYNQCSKTCEEGHQCKRKCYQLCGPCTFTVSKTLPNCGHSVKTHCNKKETEVKCDAKCNKVLSCGHECTNKCYENCITKCMETLKIVSRVCGHNLNVPCSFIESVEELQGMCSKPCKETLPCGHVCKGTCSSCYQGRLHIQCHEVCERILICGHKCRFKCYESCPPCKKPCENRCSHRKCSRKCGDPCVKCYKLCNWVCHHAKCSQLCYEQCDREPCNEPCMKLLPCNHSCIGFCGEPCPKMCAICDKKVFDKYQSDEASEEDHRMYIYLEDCKHLFKEENLNKWFLSYEPNSIKMRTCPKCNTIIRRNVRFNKLIKTCTANIEKVKILMLNDREENMKIQRNLLEHPRLSLICNDPVYKPITDVLSSDKVRTIQELVKFGNIISIAAEAETNFNTLDILYSHAHEKEIKNFSQYCSAWIKEFIIDNFLTVSDYQLEQLSTEAYRLTLIDTFLKFVCEIPEASSLSEFETCLQCLINYKPFCNDSIEKFKTSFQSLVSNENYDIDNMLSKNVSCSSLVNFSQNWNLCCSGHLNFVNLVENICYECKINENDSKMLNIVKTVDATTTESSVLSNKEHDLKMNLISDPSNDLNTKEKTFSQYGYFVQSRLSKELVIYSESKITRHENENINSECSLKSKSRAFLSILLSKKLNVLLTVGQSRNGLDERVKNSEHHNTYRRRTKYGNFKGNWNTVWPSKDRNEVTLKESFSNEKTKAGVKEQAESSGAVPKSRTYCNESRYGRKGNKFYRCTRPENVSTKNRNWRFKDDTKTSLENKDLNTSYVKKSYRDSRSDKDQIWSFKRDIKNKPKNEELNSEQGSGAYAMGDN